MQKFAEFTCAESEFLPIDFDMQNDELPLEDYGLIGDGKTAALVGRHGAIDWLCLPRFDSQPLFAALLDKKRGGSFWIRPVEARFSRQAYVKDTGVLVTEMRDESSSMRIIDALTLQEHANLIEGMATGRNELVRHVIVDKGPMTIELGFFPRYESREQVREDGFIITLNSNLQLRLQIYVTANRVCKPGRQVLKLNQGDEFSIVLRWCIHSFYYRPFTPEKLIHQTVDVWKKWVNRIDYKGIRPDLIKRSAVTLKMLDYVENGAIIAAPTSSLPEEIGGERNWDYRYVWVRDACFTGYALRRIGLTSEAQAFLAWVMDDAECEHGQPSLIYTVDGKIPPEETISQELEGYRGSKPVRFGNDAARQIQHDVYGEIIDAAYEWSEVFTIGQPLWKKFRPFIDAAAKKWQEPGHGIWEKRGELRTHTYSAGICHVALDRGLRIAEKFNLPGDYELWRSEASKIQNAILDSCWDPKLQALHGSFEQDGLDASVLALPLRKVIDANHPKMVATAETIAEHLSAGSGLIYRYDPGKSPDGLSGKEGAFVLCSFWLVEVLALQGKTEKARELFETMCDKLSSLGLMAEQINPSSGRFLGNFPQGLSHVGLIASAYRLSQLLQDSDL
ncbi:MAG: glycoside hydrolase family 15 protein [Oligoflexus sp.]